LIINTEITNLETYIYILGAKLDGSSFKKIRHFKHLKK